MRTRHFGLTIALALVPSLAVAQTTALDRQLVEEGRRIFFEETFEGNGRTCVTCHPATHNFTIDPEFIAMLPSDDPLFVAETVPELAELEDPALMRAFGLILENVDGFDNSPVFRSVPHNVGMMMSVTADPDQIGGRDAVGWSGDGAPGEGTLRDFLTGAITQHFPRTLARRPGIDFRLPTEQELDAVEAFLLSLGRTVDIDLSAMVFDDAAVDAGRRLFLGEDGVNRSCSSCHHNAGANNDEGMNRNFDTGVRRATFGLEALGIRLPPDGGFGTAPLIDDSSIGGDGGMGDGRFNVPSLIEAADTPPFFHDNSAETIEDAVAFYTTDMFGDSPSGQSGGPFDLTPGQVEQVAAFLRAINAQENIRNGNVLSLEAQRLRGPDALSRVAETIAETEDAIEVLTEGPLALFPPAVRLLRGALQLENTALVTAPAAQRNRLLVTAQRIKDQASLSMLALQPALVANADQ